MANLLQHLVIFQAVHQRGGRSRSVGGPQFTKWIKMVKVKRAALYLIDGNWSVVLALVQELF